MPNTRFLTAASCVIYLILPRAEQSNAQSNDSRSRNFSGVVRRSDGVPIPNAHVDVYLDRLPSQSYSADSNGNFNLKFPTSVQNIHLHVSKEGYVALDRDTSPDRSGPELIILRPSLQHAAPATSHALPSTQSQREPPLEDKSGKLVLLENNGQITGLVMSNNTIVGSPKSSEQSAAIRVNGGGVDLTIDNNLMCSLNSWDDLLECVAHMPGKSEWILNDVNSFQSRVDRDFTTFEPRLTEAERACWVSFDKAMQALKEHTNDEVATLAMLRGAKPSCLR